MFLFLPITCLLDIMLNCWAKFCFGHSWELGVKTQSPKRLPAAALHELSTVCFETPSKGKLSFDSTLPRSPNLTNMYQVTFNFFS